MDRSKTSAFGPPIQAVSRGAGSGIEVHHVGKTSSRANKKLKSPNRRAVSFGRLDIAGSIQNFESNKSDTRNTAPTAIRPACSNMSRGGG